MKTRTLPLGELYITRGAKAQLHIPDALRALNQHRSGDFGIVSEADREANMEAMENGERVLSAYLDKNGVKFWIITEWDRSITTILLPEEY